MMFFFKPKVIHLDCFTSRPDVFEMFPIDYSHKFFPQWWKDLPKVLDNTNQFWGMNSAKSCPGIINFYANGITIPLWSDVLIYMDGQSMQWQFSDRITEMSSHPPEQIGNFLNIKDYFHLKIASPWLFNCKENINFMWTQSTWSFNNPKEIMIPPGIIDYTYQSGTNINFFVSLPEENKQKKLLIEAGQSMVNVIPLSERKIKLHRHLISQEEHFKMSEKVNSQFVFQGKYSKRKQIIQNKEKKCPFGF